MTLAAIHSIETLEDALSRPAPRAIAAMAACPGDVLVLGAGGKMGPTLARMVRRAADRIPGERRVIAVSRFSSRDARTALEQAGVETIGGDLLEPGFLQSLPECPNVIYMAGMKFGATGNEGLTWAMNCHLPGLVMDRFRHSRIAAFSTGNVYGLVPVTSEGSRESDPLRPVGEYAMSCVGRERMIEYGAIRHNTPAAILRLNYACELRYGVLVDVAQRVYNRQPIDLAMGYANVIWQGDANAMAIASLAHTASPAAVFNIAGPEKLSIRETALQFGERFGIEPSFEGAEAPDALLNDGRAAYDTLGAPTVTAGDLIAAIARWIRSGGPLLGKPTHYDLRSGAF